MDHTERWMIYAVLFLCIILLAVFLAISNYTLPMETYSEEIPQIFLDPIFKR